MYEVKKNWKAVY